MRDREVCVVGGVHGRGGVRGLGHAWQEGACVVGGHEGPPPVDTKATAYGQ